MVVDYDAPGRLVSYWPTHTQPTLITTWKRGSIKEGFDFVPWFSEEY